MIEQGVPWHSGNYRVLIHSDTRTWRDKNIQSRRRLSANAEELEAMAWDLMQNVFYIDLSSYKKDFHNLS